MRLRYLYVHSKVMAWVALRQGAQLAHELRYPDLAERWRREADALHAESASAAGIPCGRPS